MFHDKYKIRWQAAHVFVVVHIHWHGQRMHIKIIPLVPQFILDIHGIFLFDVVQEISQLVGGFYKTIYFDDLYDASTCIRPCSGVIIRGYTSLISSAVSGCGLGHAGKNIILNIDYVFLV